ncbi:MAG: ATP-binding cassette domain-containing protein [Acidimicrobiaceae bacterium]|nr:ATP-binding cassette domain-containing protein [Acidimicrobiaceae bacterium]MDE0666932.1 ATP-binding cassette domain-containing protein [Acidimicrobiaceae bacterium]MXY10374.1 ATP-binding cassette domain-containing protein [Acidimicrobiaceae bacterium]MXZ63987.1 ATP-binding cassette domain-containing protein [Acidimicrobiaceae bacterium]MYA14412.1 ATP-binding cassette domain-containing protein [Acidimicrobiaceae bacterium]
MTLPLAGFEVPHNVVILGLITGLTYSLLGLGITLVYRSSRVINFAHGEMGALAALMIPIFALNLGWPYAIALVIALMVAAAVGGLFEFLVIRPLRSASRLTVLVATIGASQLLFFGGALLPKGGDIVGKIYPTPFDWRFTLGKLILGPGQLTILVAVPILTIALTLFLGRSRLGKASRAAAENTDAARLAGVPIDRVSFAVWTAAGLLAGVSAILIGPTRPLALSQALGPQLMLKALAAAMLGGLTRFSSVFAAGIAIGILEALVLWNYPIGGALDLVLFAAIAGSFLMKKGLGSVLRGSEQSSWSLAAAITPLAPAVAGHFRVRSTKVVLLGAMLAAAAYLPARMTSSEQFFLGAVALFAVLGLSLVVLTGFAGQVSLGQFAFVAVGAALGGRLYQMGLPHGPTLVAVTVAGGLVALLIGVPALRIRGLFLAVITLAFSVAASGWLLEQDWLNHRGSDGGTSMSIPRPTFAGAGFDDEIRYYWVCLGALLVTMFAVHRLRRSGLGRRMVAVRDNEPSAASMAVSPRTTKLSAFVISGMIASFGGFLYGGLLVTFSGDIDGTFGPGESLSLVVMTIFGGVTTITGAVLGAFWVQGIPRILGEDWGLLSSGIGVLAVLLLLPGGLASVVFATRDKLVEAAAARGLLPGTEPAGEVADDRVPAPTEPVAPPVRSGDDEVLAASGVSVTYGGVSALRDVSISVKRHEIVGVMGPNGAGKTTLFDVLSGHQRPDSGIVLLDGRDISSLPAHRRARLGLGRSFQQARLFEDMMLVDAVSLASERDMPIRLAPMLLGTPRARRQERERDQAALQTLERLGLTEHAHHQIGNLSTGTRRLAELACALALGAHVVLLDEPTAGLSPREVDDFVRVISELHTRLSMTIVVIDHDVAVMRSLVDRLYVLEAGDEIAAGPPSILDTDRRVVEAYMGTRDPGPFSTRGASDRYHEGR